MVRSLSADPSRSLVATASNDHTVRLWSIAQPGQGTLLRIFSGHTDQVTGVTFNQNDSTQLASCGKDRTVRFWTVATGAQRRVDLENVPQCIAYRTNSNILAVGLADEPQVMFIDANTGIATDRPFETTSPATRIAYGSGGERIYCGLASGVVEVYDARTKERLSSHTVSSRPIMQVSEVRGRLTAVSDDGVVLIVDSRGAAERVELLADLTAATFSSNLDTLMVSTTESEMVSIVLATRSKQSTSVSAKQIDAIVQLQNGTTLLYGEVDAQEYSWWIRPTGGPGYQRLPTLTVQQSAVALSDDGSLLAVGDNHGNVTVYGLQRPLTPIRFTNLGFRKISALSFSHGSNRLAVGGFGDTYAAVINIEDWSIEHVAVGARSIVAVSDVAGVVFFLHDENAQEIVSLDLTGTPYAETVVGAVQLMGHSTNGKYLVAVGKKQVLLFDAATMHVLSKAPCELPATITAIGVYPSGDSAVIGTMSGELIVLETRSGKRTRELPGMHTGSVSGISITGNVLETTGADGKVRDWNASTLRPLERQSGHDHRGKVLALATSNDGRFVATSGADGQVNVWRRDSAQYSRTIVQMGDDWAVFDADGRFDASPNGMRRLMVVVGLDAYPIDRLRQTHYRPLFLADEAPASPAPREPDPKADQITAAVPQARVASQVPADAVANAPVTVDVELTGGHKNGTLRLEVFNNEKLIAVHRITMMGGSFTTSIPVTLVADSNHLRFVPSDERGSGVFDEVLIVARKEVARGPRVFILAIGINAYRNPMYDLLYARDDAMAMVDLLSSSVPQGTSSKVISLLDEDATVLSVRKALVEIEAQALPDDAFVFYYAGHGAVLAQQDGSAEYCFAMHGVADMHDNVVLSREGFLADSLRSALLRIKAQRQMVVIDACYSGLMLEAFQESENARYVSDLQRSTGATVLASVLPDKRAKELEALKHGVFTYALLKGLEGEAEDRDGDVTVFSLLNYLTKAMPALGKQFGTTLQQPVIRFEGAARPLVLSHTEG